MKALVYDIDTEGWLQFERLIDYLLTLEEEDSEGPVVSCVVP